MFPVVSLTGPRQAGKTTLLKDLYPKYCWRTLISDNSCKPILSPHFGIAGPAELRPRIAEHITDFDFEQLARDVAPFFVPGGKSGAGAWVS